MFFEVGFTKGGLKGWLEMDFADKFIDLLIMLAVFFVPFIPVVILEERTAKRGNKIEI